MPRVITKQKGNRFDKADYHVPYFTTAFFNPSSERNGDDNKESTRSQMVKLPIKIAADGDDSRANVTNVYMPGITHFDNNVEAVLESLSQLMERVIKPKGIDDSKEEWKVTLQLLQFICHSSPASQTLQDCMRAARTRVYEKYLLNDDDVEEDILTSDEPAFYLYIEGTWKRDELPEGVATSTDYTELLFQEHKRYFWNHLNSIIFGADAYRAYKQQKDYMQHKIVKPFGVPVEAAFRRVEVVAKYMEYFPPPCSRGKQATQEQWDRFEETKKVTADLKKEMKYNLLPEAYHDRFNKLENNWSEMSNSKFLSGTKKFATVDAKGRQ